MARQVTHRALDGTRIRLASDHGLDLRRPYTSVGKVAVGGRLHEVTGGSVASGRAWARDLGADGFAEEYRLRGGRLRICRATVRDHHAGLAEQVLGAVWEGRRHAAYTHLYHARAADAVALFERLRPVERSEGVVLDLGEPRRAAFAEPPELVKEVPGVGLLEITTLTRQSARRLPPWPGARTAAGELFQDIIEGQGVYFVLATASLLVTVLPDERERLQDVPGRVAGLSVEAVA